VLVHQQDGTAVGAHELAHPADDLVHDAMQVEAAGDVFRDFQEREQLPRFAACLIGAGFLPACAPRGHDTIDAAEVDERRAGNGRGRRQFQAELRETENARTSMPVAASSAATVSASSTAARVATARTEGSSQKGPPANPAPKSANTISAVSTSR